MASEKVRRKGSIDCDADFSLPIRFIVQNPLAIRCNFDFVQGTFDGIEGILALASNFCY